MSTLTGPVLAEYQDLFSTSTTAGGPNGGLNLGAKAYTGDGREFRFVLAGAATLVPGKLQQSSAEATTLEGVAPAAAAIGATSVTITSSLTVAANILAGGYLTIDTTPGQGYTYKIKANTAVTSATGMVVTLEDPILVALTTSSTVTLIASPYSNVIVNPATASGTPVGVAVFPVTNAQYGWLQVTGPCNVLADGAITVGTSVCASNGTAGAVEPTAGVQAPVGTAINGIVSTHYGPIQLRL
jgi:hypothetical protein